MPALFKLKTSLAAASIFAANAVICRRLFLAEYINQMGSVDGPQIAMARYVMEHHRDMAWWPWWFCGMPHAKVYGPALHVFVAAIAGALGVSPAIALHTIVALFYCLGPVMLFWMTLRLSGSRQWAICAGMLYTMVSPAAMLIPLVRSDLGGMLYSRRLQILVVYGEYPHIATLFLMPVAIIIIESMLRRKRPASLAWTALILAGIALTSVTGSVGFVLVAVAYLLARPVLAYRTDLIWTGTAVLLAYGLACRWLPPSTILSIAENSKWGLGGHFLLTARHILYFAPIACGAALVRAVLAKLGAPKLLLFSLLLVFLTKAVVLPAAWSGVSIVPQPLRFQLEFEMGCCLAGGFVLAKLLDRVSMPWVSVIALLALSIALVGHNLRRANEWIRPIDITQTIEYKTAVWFDQHMGGRRVFAPGSISLWLNVFSDTRQLGGCCDQGVPSWEQRVALYTIYIGQNTGQRDGQVSVTWLQAYGVHAIAIGGAKGNEYFKAFRNPLQFEGLLPVLWRDGDDAIYGVPLRSDSLAHVVHESQIVSRAPADGLDLEPLRPYVAALNDPRLPLAHMKWTSGHSAQITADVQPGDVLSVQVSNHSGWRATSNGLPSSIDTDGLGMMVVRPQCSGECTVDLLFDGGMEMRIASIVQILSGFAFVSLLLAPRLRSVLRKGPW